MRGLMRRLLLLAVACVMASNVCAQSPVRMELGQTTSGPAIGDGGAYYAFAGAMGTRLKMHLVVDSLAAVALYDVHGTELASTQARNSILLEQTLEDDGIYLISITSANTNEPYTLTLEGQVPRIELVYDEPAATVTKGATPEVQAPVAASPPAVTADPAVWGVYARLVGRRTQEVKSRYTLVWLWQEPGKVLLELWQDGTGEVRFTTTITPSGEPGRLLMHTNYLGDKDWDGTITADGNVNFIGRGMFKFPYQAALTAQDVFEMRRVQSSKAGELVHPANKHSRWPMQPQSQ